MPAPSSVTPMRRLAAAVGEDVDAGRAGVNRVLNQLLDDAGRTLDHFAGGDAVDDSLGKLADGHARLSAGCDRV